MSSATQQEIMSTKNGDSKKVIEFNRYFTNNGNSYEDYFHFGNRDVSIKDVSGNVIYDGKNVEFPVGWSDSAAKIVADKYFHKGDDKKNPVETSMKQLNHRVIDAIAKSTVQQGILSESSAKNLYQDLSYLILNQSVSFNSPVWFNVGLHEAYGIKNKSLGGSGVHYAVDENGDLTNNIDTYKRPQSSACFIIPIEDDLASILDHAKKEGMVFKYGSGTGSNFSTLRGTNEPLSGGGVASGLISFLQIYDSVAGSVQSGGKTRRAAKMTVVDCDHPDFLRFINWKVEEEKKALWLSARSCWAPCDASDLESSAYKTVQGQNANNSVRVSDEFMTAALNDRLWDLVYRTADRVEEEIEIKLEDYEDCRHLPDKRFLVRATNKRKTVKAADVLELIARATYASGDPGIQFDTTINEWHTCPNSGKINASNPCSEFMFLDNTSCNLASLNLIKYTDENKLFDIKSFEKAVRTTIIAQETLVDKSSYPAKEVAENSHKFRPLGLGYANLGALLMSHGLPYDSPEGRSVASAITSMMTANAYETSADMAEAFGPFEGYSVNKKPMLNVIEKHREHSQKIEKTGIKGLEEILNAANAAWDRALEKGKMHGFRNAQVSLLAPTGTIGFKLDVDCTGIEPMVALKTKKGLAGGGELEKEIASPCVVAGLKALGYNSVQIKEITDYIAHNGTIAGAPELHIKHYDIFATSMNEDNCISVDGHLNMMAAVQPFLSGAISKTVNLPKSSTIKDIKETYVKAWKLGLKAVAPYVDGSKGVQPVNIVTELKNGKNGPKYGDQLKPYNDDGQILRKGWKVKIQAKSTILGVHFMVGEYENRPPQDAPGDFFVCFGSSGSPFSGIYDSWAIAVSRCRQYGSPLDEFIEDNMGATDPISGPVLNHPFIKTCSGIKDLCAKIVALEYFADTSVCDVQPSPEEIANLRCNVLAKRRRERHFESRLEFINKVMNDGKITEFFPLYEDDIRKGALRIYDVFCKKCGYPTVLSGANCRKCNNCGDAGGCG